MDYVVSDAKLQELNELINKAGAENTSEMSTRHEQTVAVANTLPDSVGSARSKIIKLTESAQGFNEMVGTTLGEMQQWHDDVKASGGGVEPEPPKPPHTVDPPDPFPNTGVRHYWGPMMQNVKYVTHAGGPGQMEWSLGAGSGAYKTWVNGVLVIDGGMQTFPVNGGDTVEMMQTSQAQGDANGSIVNR